MRNQQKIIISGMGGCSAAGRNLEEIAGSLTGKTVNCRPVPENLFRSRLSCPVFASDYAIPSPGGLELLEQSGRRWNPKTLNRTILLTLTALAEALEDAGLEPSVLRTYRVGIALGTTVGCTFHDEQYFIDWRQGAEPEPSPVFHYLQANLALFLQSLLGTSGPIAVVTNACASGTDAIGIAREWLKNGTCDIAIAGGADALSRIAYYGFASLMLLADTPCSPFDQDRSGLNLGEGAGILILENREIAARRNARVHGWITGYGAASDCYHPTAPHPDGRGLQSALQKALQEAALTGDSISYINAHGTGTRANDSAEMNALAALNLKGCPIVSTKGLTGHMLGAAGALEAILTLQALRAGRTGGTINCRTPDDALPLAPLLEEGETILPGKTGISQSLAFGGTNSALVLEAAGP